MIPPGEFITPRNVIFLEPGDWFSANVPAPSVRGRVAFCVAGNNPITSIVSVCSDRWNATARHFWGYDYFFWKVPMSLGRANNGKQKWYWNFLPYPFRRRVFPFYKPSDIHYTQWVSRLFANNIRIGSNRYEYNKHGEIVPSAPVNMVYDSEEVAEGEEV